MEVNARERQAVVQTAGHGLRCFGSAHAELTVLLAGLVVGVRVDGVAGANAQP